MKRKSDCKIKLQVAGAYTFLMLLIAFSVMLLYFIMN